MRTKKQGNSAHLLLVDESVIMRKLLAHVLLARGMNVRCAESGLVALAEIEQENPDIVLTDLNMQEMSGFDLLRVLHRQYPAIKLIAMSNSFHGDEVPSGIVADAYYPKGSGVRCLMKIISGLIWDEKLPCRPHMQTAPMWIQRSGQNDAGQPCVTINCPKCLCSFTQNIDGALKLIREVRCAHCRIIIYFAIAEPVEWVPQARHQQPLLDVILREAAGSCSARGEMRGQLTEPTHGND